MKTASRTLACLILAVSAALSAEPRAEPTDVSIIRLIASPKDYARKLVRIVGYLSVEFEGDAIYLHEEDFRRSLTTNGLAVGATDKTLKQLRKLSGQYVIIEGVFDPSLRGHLGLFSGGIGNITRVDAWNPGPAPTAPPP